MSTFISVVGTVATEPKEISAGSTVLCTFRLACSERRLNRESHKWEDGPTNWFTVNAFRALATHAAQSLSKGDRVIVQGKLRIKSWQREAKSGTSVEIDAEALGPELRWGTTTFTKTAVTAPEGETTQGAARGWHTAQSTAAAEEPGSQEATPTGMTDSSSAQHREPEHASTPF